STPTVRRTNATIPPARAAYHAVVEARSTRAPYETCVPTCAPPALDDGAIDPESKPNPKSSPLWSTEDDTDDRSWDPLAGEACPGWLWRTSPRVRAKPSTVAA